MRPGQPDDCEPTWLDDPDALDALCNLGAELFYDGPPPRDMTTIQPPEEYL